MSKTDCDRNCSTCDLGNRSFCAVQIGMRNQELLMLQGETIEKQNEVLKSLIEILTPLVSKESLINPIVSEGKTEKSDD